MAPVSIDPADFDEFLRSSRLAVVLFSHRGSIVSRMMEEMLSRALDEHSFDGVFGKMEPYGHNEVAERLGIRNDPVTQVYCVEKIASQVTGLLPQDVLTAIQACE